MQNHHILKIKLPTQGIQVFAHQHSMVDQSGHSLRSQLSGVKIDHSEEETISCVTIIVTVIIKDKFSQTANIFSDYQKSKYGLKETSECPVNKL